MVPRANYIALPSTSWVTVTLKFSNPIVGVLFSGRTLPRKSHFERICLLCFCVAAGLLAFEHTTLNFMSKRLR